MKSKELRAKRAKLIEDARALLPTDRLPTPEENQKFDAAMAEADGLKAQIDRIERAETLEAEQNEAFRHLAQRNGSDPDQERDRSRLEADAFGAWMRNGMGTLAPEHAAIAAQRLAASPHQAMAGWNLDRPRNALGVGTGSAGGDIVPQGFYDRLIDAQKYYGGMLEAGFVFDTATGNAMPVPTDNDTSNAGAILGENTQVSTQDITFGAVTLNAYVYSSKLVLVSNQLLQDSAFDLDAFLSQKLGTRIARAINTHFTVGTGSSQPTGIVGSGTNSAALGYTCGGSTSSGETANVTFDDIVELEHSVDPAYRRAAKFMFSDSTLKAIKKLKDGLGRPLWAAGLAVKEPDTINSYSYVINQDMPSLGASNKFMAFGDFSNYFIRRVAGVQILRLTERYADYNQVGFMAFQRWDGQMVDAGTHPVTYLQNSAT